MPAEDRAHSAKPEAPSQPASRGCCGVGSHTWNVLRLGVGFFFISFAFNTQGFIEENVVYSYSANANQNDSTTDTTDEHGNNHAGYISLAICYAVMTLSSLISVPIVGCLKAKWSMVVGSMCTVVFLIGFFFMKAVYLYISSAIVGFGYAVLWSAQGKYLSLNSSEENSGKHSALFFASNEMSVTVGGIFLLVIFTVNKESEGLSDLTLYVIYGVFIGTTIIGGIIFFFLPTSELIDKDPPLSVCSLTGSTFKLAFDSRMALLLVVFTYTGIEMSFWSSVYPTCISFTLNIHANPRMILALCIISLGLGQLLACVVFGVTACRQRRALAVGLATILQLVVYAAVTLWFPADSPLKPTYDSSVLDSNIAVALICAFLLGFADASWNVQISACLLEYFPTQSLQAFSLFNFFQSLATSVAFVYSFFLPLHYHSLILAIGAALGCACFLIAEHVHLNHDRSVKK